MATENILVVVVDGLRASALGAYGNTTSSTPSFDQFAAQGVVADWCYAPTVNLAENYAVLWGGSPSCLPRELGERGLDSTLITDEAALLELKAARDFNQQLHVDGNRKSRRRAARATDSNGTAFASLFASAAEIVTSAGNGRKLVWLHSRGLYGPWDAPLELQEALRDEGDPPPVEEVAPPDMRMTADDDPDVVFRYATAYAAQVTVLDKCWAMLLRAIHGTGAADSWNVILVGARGFPLGEHGRIGGVDDRPYGEQLHVPWMMCRHNEPAAPVRSGQLVTLADVATVIREASMGDAALLTSLTQRAPVHHSIRAAGAFGQRAIRTAEWCLLQTGGEPAGLVHDARHELYVRPDDRWEANDVAKLCPQDVEALASVIEESPPRAGNS